MCYFVCFSFVEIRLALEDICFECLSVFVCVGVFEMFVSAAV